VIPVTVLTGFLGSGKTTLLRKLLRSEEFARTAVIVNEFGEIGLDHELVAASDESLVQLTTGCLCCRVRSDLVLTLQDLAARRAAGAVPSFERVVIETSGLADPASILQALMTDAAVAEVVVRVAPERDVDGVPVLRVSGRGVADVDLVKFDHPVCSAARAESAASRGRTLSLSQVIELVRKGKSKSN
jgi:G3E family GTPase